MIRENNEDNFVVNPDLAYPNWTCANDGVSIDLGRQGMVMAVADGMGGANAGEVASRIAVSAIERHFDELVSQGGPWTDEQCRLALTQALLLANQAIVAHAHQHRESRGMGTTGIICWLYQGVAHVGWVGDSRAYLYRPGLGLRPLSKDHSFVQELVDAGKITYEQAFYHPDSNIITQSLGNPDHEPTPGYYRLALEQADRVLLCSDGLNGMLPDPELAQILGGVADIQECSDQLISAANLAGGNDNITLTLLDVVEGPPATAADIPPVGANLPPTPGPAPSKLTITRYLPWLVGLAALLLGLVGWLFWQSHQQQQQEQLAMAHLQDSLRQDSLQRDSLLALENAKVEGEAIAPAPTSPSAPGEDPVPDPGSPAHIGGDTTRLGQEAAVGEPIKKPGSGAAVNMVWAIRVGVYDSENAARRKRRELEGVSTSLGKSVIIIKENGKNMVYLIPFDDALSARQINQHSGLNGVVEQVDKTKAASI